MKKYTYATLLTLLACLLGFQGTAHAASACYNAEELQAEEMLRLHSELMVIAVTCTYGSNGQQLIPAYTAFTNKNINELHQAEQTLTSFYKKNGGGNGLNKLDKLRTQLANEFGQQIARVSAPTYCAQNRDKVLTLSGAARSELAGEIDTLQASAHNYAPVCGAKSGHSKG